MVFSNAVLSDFDVVVFGGDGCMQSTLEDAK